MKKLIAAVSAVFIAVTLSIVAVAAPASAHTATLTGTTVCNTDGSATIKWTIDNDWGEIVKVTASNDASIPVGSTVAAKPSNGPDTTGTYNESVAAPAAGKSVTATLSFLWEGDNYTQNNTSYTVKVSSDCKAQLTKDASASVTTTAAGCGVAATATEGTITNATWGTPVSTSNSYSVVATAIAGHAFSSAGTNGTLSNGNTVDTFNVSLAGPLSSELCRTASAAITTSVATCDGPETATEGTVAHATWGTAQNTGTTWTAVATAVTGYQFGNANGGVLSQGNTVDTFTVQLAPIVTGHPCEDYKIVAWTMPSWVNSTTPTWSQTYFTSQEESTPDLSALDSQLTEKCGVQYQVDIYYNSPITASLIAGGYLNGPNNPEEDLIPGGWGVAYKLVQGPLCANPVPPTVGDACTTGGTITIEPATGVVYYLNGTAVDTSAGEVTETGLSGENTVTAVAQTGYLLTGYPDGGYSYDFTDNCSASYQSSGTCTSSNGASTETVTLTLTNPSNSTADFEITAGDANSTVTAGSFLVPGNTTENETVGYTTDAGGSFLVVVNGGTAQTVTVGVFTGCLPALGGDPSVQQATCDQDTNTPEANNSITIDLEPGLVYTITGPAGFTTLTDLTPASNGGQSGDWVAASDVPNGLYHVSVTNATGYVLDSKYSTESWPFPLNVTTPVCDIAVSATPAQCTTDITSAAITAANTPEPTITVQLDPNVVYTAVQTDVTPNVSTVLTATTTTVPQGEYTVNVTLSADGVTNGFVIPAGQTSFGPYDLTGFCPPTEASWNAGASGSDAVCTSGVTTDGVITLVHSAGQAGKVTYTITNTVTNKVVYTGNTDNAVSLPAGSYSVTATPPAGDGISGNTQNNPGGSEIFPTIVIGTSSTDCDGTLAFTGGTIAWVGFILAGGMLFLGIALLFMRRRGNRTAE